MQTWQRLRPGKQDGPLQRVALGGDQMEMAQTGGEARADAAQQGDAAAKAVVAQYAVYVAAGLTDFVNILAPEMILLTDGPLLLDIALFGLTAGAIVLGSPGAAGLAP